WRARRGTTWRSGGVRVRRGLGDMRTGSSTVAFFFFQAEDGIRDLIVTGVQTCALPISVHPTISDVPDAIVECTGSTAPSATGTRSEERRVGKECRSRRWAEH